MCIKSLIIVYGLSTIFMPKTWQVILKYTHVWQPQLRTKVLKMIPYGLAVQFLKYQT